MQTDRREPGSHEPDDRKVDDQMTRLAQALWAQPGSDARAGLSAIVREIEETTPGFFARLAAVNDARRLGIRAHATTQ